MSLFESPSEDPQAALESLGLGDQLPVVLAEFHNEFSAIQSYF